MKSDEQIDLAVNECKLTFFNAGWGFLVPEEITGQNAATLEMIKLS